MKLIKFQENKKRHIYINADKIQVVRPVNDHATMIQFEGHMITVRHDMEEVVRLLQQTELY